MTQKQNVAELLMFLRKNNGKPSDVRWWELAERFGIEPTGDYKRGTRAYKEHLRSRVRSIWRRYLRGGVHNIYPELELSRIVETDGGITSRTYRRASQMDIPDLKGFAVKKVTTNPFSDKAWITYSKDMPALTKEFLDSLAKQLKKDIEPVNIKRPPEYSERSLLLYGADKHIGALTLDNSIYRNDYDKDEIQRRLLVAPLEFIERAVNEYGPFKDIIIFELGDALDGYNGKTSRGNLGKSSHTLPQQMDNREQFELYIQIHKALFDALAQMGVADRISFVATGNSNHGGDFEYVAIKALEIYLNERYPEIRTYVTDRFMDHIIIGNHAFIFSHGNDGEDKKYGFPVFLDSKAENFISDYIDINKLNDYNVTVVSGDMHTRSEVLRRKFRYKKVLSQYGSSRWMHLNYHGTVAGYDWEILDHSTGDIISGFIRFDSHNRPNTGFGKIS